MRFKPSTITTIARYVCGDAPSPFPYRGVKALVEFYGGLGFALNLEGQTRNQGSQAALAKLNLDSPVDGKMPSAEMVTLIEELMNLDYFDASAEIRIDLRAAHDLLNKALSPYALEIVYPEGNGHAKLSPIGGTYVSSVLRPREATRKITFCPSVFKVPDEPLSPDLAAVMMPFAAHFSSVYSSIQKACKWSGLRCQRVDDIWQDSTIIQDIFNLLFLSSIVIVDFTGKNPNVMYETGIAHTLGKHVVPITQSMEDVPFDLKHHRILRYLPNGEGLKILETELERRLTTLVRELKK
ncbi:hypothetical protein [Singulisphaera sp. PoT]|uniref:hypothetical protein n=1 Tax=Singulisphaera sp. PoT TaxID=3411797 RepID=UPI003BF49D11